MRFSKKLLEKCYKITNDGVISFYKGLCLAELLVFKLSLCNSTLLILVIPLVETNIDDEALEVVGEKLQESKKL